MLCQEEGSSEENKVDQKTLMQTYIQEYFHSFDIKKCSTFWTQKDRQTDEHLFANTKSPTFLFLFDRQLIICLT